MVSNYSFSTYKLYKQQVLEIFETYKNLRGEMNDGVDIVGLERRISNLKNNQFLVAVAGEVKAGKSTFINSLIKEEILPTDVLQATSALIEIFYSKKPFLRITYASGKIDTIEEDSKEIFKIKLKEVASIPEEYRDLPVSLIDLYILEHGTYPKIDDEFIRYLEEKSGLENLKKLRYKLENYLLSRNKDNIPIRIELGYPFDWEFDEIRLVDMPGVNAIGGVYDLSFSFLERANAVLFIHPIKPVESESFKKFVSSVITKKSKDVLFLILTHGAVFFEEKERLLEEAKRIYGSTIPQDRIFVVDSLLKLIYEDLNKGKSFEEIKKEKHKRKWVVYFQDLAEEEGLNEKEAFLQYSGFKELLPALERFLIETPMITLAEILDTIREGYNEQINIYKETINLLESQKKDREEFVREIEKRQEGLKKLEAYIYLILEEANTYFRGVHSPVEKLLDELKMSYYEVFLKSMSIEELRKHYRDAENDLDSLVKDSLKAISNFFTERLNQIGEKFSEEYKIHVPKIDLTSIEESCRRRVIRREEIVEERVESLLESWNFLKPWKWFKSARTKKFIVGTKEILDEEAFLKVLKNELIENFIEVIEKLREEFYKAFDFYKKRISAILEEKRNYLEKLKQELKSNERIDYEILILEKNITLIEMELKKIEKLKNLINA